MSETRACRYCGGSGEIETDNNGPIGPCPVCKPDPLRDMLRAQDRAMRDPRDHSEDVLDMADPRDHDEHGALEEMREALDDD